MFHLKPFVKSLVTLVLVTIVTSTVFASGKMEVPLGGQVTLQTDAVQAGGSYKWVTKRGREILNTQSNSIYSYTFELQGEYEVSLSVTDRSGAIKNTVVDILVGDRYSAVESSGFSSGSISGSVFPNTPLEVSVETLPALTAQKTIYIPGDEGRVVFDIASRPDILEYRIDRNVYVDSDGDGIANNDIDNDGSSSYLLGGVWHTKYSASESNKIAAEVTVVNTQGQKAKTQVEVLFGSLPSKEGKVVAILDTLPALDQDSKRVYIYGDEDTVAFYPRRSQGDIVEYRIDKNIFVDSDGDGNPANDIDNRNDISFKTGYVWTTDYQKTDTQIIAQLIVVGTGGTGSRIQREIVFSDAPQFEYSEIPTEQQQESVIRLTADKEFVQKGDPITFSVEGLTQDLSNYIFEWDFNGDGEVDQTIEGDNTASYIYDTASIQSIKVRVADLDGNEANFNIDLLVKDIAFTKAEFDYEIDGLTVNFSNLSEVNQNLSSKILQYNWAFGDPDADNFADQRDKTGVENPTYTYSAPGTYIVSLMVVDSDQVADTKTVEVLVEAPEGYVSPEEAAQAQQETQELKKEGGSIIGAIFKIILYIILIVILLVVLIIIGLLGFLKLQHPDLVFEELIDEMKIKILNMIGVSEDMIEPVSSDYVPGEPETAPEPEVEESVAPKPVTENPSVEPPAAPEPDLSQADAPMPEWLKPKKETPAEPKKEVIEGELEEETPATPKADSAPAPETPAKPEADNSLNKNDGPVPDWLK